MERDDIIEYSLEGHHSEEKGKQLRKTIWKVTALLTAITAIEVLMGAYIKQGDNWTWEITKWVFVALTLLKAGFIVLSFMHLGDERKTMRYVILIPYFIFILYLIFILLWEATAVGDLWTNSAV
ncbi:MAG: cytochrome C oxidase subunit IV family protein [Crocinitomicaceae bacterium]|nr:cytochrome C oxidase subunit IV family protein [Crocinitomicaceae bacterium]